MDVVLEMMVPENLEDSSDDKTLITTRRAKRLSKRERHRLEELRRDLPSQRRCNFAQLTAA